METKEKKIQVRTQATNNPICTSAQGMLSLPRFSTGPWCLAYSKAAW